MDHREYSTPKSDEDIEDEIRSALGSTASGNHGDTEDAELSEPDKTMDMAFLNSDEHDDSNAEANEEASNESCGLYRQLFRKEVQLHSIENIPKYLLPTTSTYSEHARTFLNLAERFRESPQRYSVYEQAQRVDLTTLNRTTFRALLDGLFLDGTYTYERVLVLFFFCTDLTIRAVQEKLLAYLHHLNNWISTYISNRVSNWVEERGGWSAVLQQSVSQLKKYTLISMCGIIILAVTLYIKSKRSA